MALSCQKDDDTPPVEGLVTDPDGQTYLWKKMDDGQTWVANNFQYAIPGYNYWWYDNDAANSIDYGRLYEMEAAAAACATLGEGWHLPTDAEWQKLATAYGGFFNWETVAEIGDASKAYEALLRGGTSGFSARLGGYGGFFSWETAITAGDASEVSEAVMRENPTRYFNRLESYKGIVFSNLGNYGLYWSATEVNDGSGMLVWTYQFDSETGKLYRLPGLKTYAYSCRCIKTPSAAN